MLYVIDPYYRDDCRSDIILLLYIYITFTVRKKSLHLKKKRSASISRLPEGAIPVEFIYAILYRNIILIIILIMKITRGIFLILHVHIT